MNHIGRKIYLQWGTLVIAVEKIWNHDELALKWETPLNEGRSIPMVMVDIFECLGQKFEKPVEGNLQPLNNCGWTIDQFITDKEFWLTQEESANAAKGNIENQEIISSLGHVFGAWIFKIGQFVSESKKKEVFDWCHERKNEGIIIKEGSIWIKDKDLATEFKLVFVDHP